jgi:hypothetical protein
MEENELMARSDTFVDAPTASRMRPPEILVRARGSDRLARRQKMASESSMFSALRVDRVVLKAKTPESSRS